jgi:hypothetical protein
MQLHESGLIHLLVTMGLKNGADKAFASNPDATMDDDIIPLQAKEIHLLLSQYIKFPEDEYELTLNLEGEEEGDDED